MHYLHVVIVLFSTSLYKSAFSTYSFGRLGFFLCFGFYVSMSLVFRFYSLFYVLNSVLMSFLIMSDFTTFSFLLTLFKWSLKIYESCHATYKEKFYSVNL